MTEKLTPSIPEIVDNGGIKGLNPYTLGWAYDFLMNYGFPKDWEEDQDVTWYFASNVWGEQGLYLGTNIPSPNQNGLLIAKIPSKSRIDITVIEWKPYGTNVEKVLWDKSLTPGELAQALGIMQGLGEYNDALDAYWEDGPDDFPYKDLK